jgi:hypothetical protein
MRRFRFSSRLVSGAPSVALRGLWLSLLMFSVACRDDTPTIRPPVEPTVDLRAQLELAPLALSQGMGTEVTIRVLPSNDAKPVASFTAQVRYDDTRWQFIDHADPGAAALVVNAGTPGLIRVAGMQGDGFVDGALTSLRFRTLADGPPKEPVLTFTELHATDNANLARVTIGSPVAFGGR